MCIRKVFSGWWWEYSPLAGNELFYVQNVSMQYKYGWLMVETLDKGVHAKGHCAPKSTLKMWTENWMCPVYIEDLMNPFNSLVST